MLFVVNINNTLIYKSVRLLIMDIYTELEPEETDIIESRERNRKALAEYFASLTTSNPGFAEYQESLNILKSHNESTVKRKSKHRQNNVYNDPVFKFTGLIPVELRKSTRLQNKKPEYSYSDLEDPDDMQYSRKRKNDFDFGDLNELKDLGIRFAAPKKKRLTHGRAMKREILKVEDVTQEMLDNICTRVKDKIYSDRGTTCHQCRQKTLDQKTCCRNVECGGLYGQFCGVCIINRYGETARDALLDPNWHCFKCRGICNCSICRNREGKLPTGILVPFCQERGAKSVRHLLDELNGKFDYGEENDDEDLLGFSDSGRRVHFKNDVVDHLWFCKLCYLNDFEDPENMLGFADHNTAHMGGGVIENTNSVLNGYSHVKQYTLFNYLDMVPASLAKVEKMEHS